MILPEQKLGNTSRTVSGKASQLQLGSRQMLAYTHSFVSSSSTLLRIIIMQRRIHGHVTNIVVRPLVEEKAVEAAAALLGNVFIFTVAGAAIIYEVQKKSKSEARKEEMRKQELEALRQTNKDMTREVELLRHKMDELSNRSIFNIFRFQYAQPYEAQSGKFT